VIGIKKMKNTYLVYCKIGFHKNI